MLLLGLFSLIYQTDECEHTFLGNFPESLLSKGLSSVSNPVLPPKKIPKEFIMKYKRGEINPVSALHQFAQMQRVQLDLKETVTTGKCTVACGYYSIGKNCPVECRVCKWY